MVKKVIAILELGGTINCITEVPEAEFYSFSYSSVNKLLEKIPIEKNIDVEIYHFSQLISHDFTVENLIKLGQKLKELLHSNKYYGIIITMGTNALEDVAYFISLTIQTETPIIFTGAHYPQKSLKFDGKKNLYNSLVIASSEQAKELGILVSFDDYVVSARDAIKFQPGLSSNFSINGIGIVGYVIGKKFIVKTKPVYNYSTLKKFPIENIESLPNIVIIYAHLGMSDIFVKAAIEARVDGIIGAGFGKGYQSKLLTHSLSKAIQQGIYVVRSSRTGQGYSNEDLKYDKENGFIISSGLSPHKASILLSIALSITKDRKKLQKIFMEC